ncbi:hypothetical protein C8Q78DRAFT_1040879 [Trametes maxima]|nr:hypothetical protein C8Q78DRAFT_1040879 [Trametes maxima]
MSPKASTRIYVGNTDCKSCHAPSTLPCTPVSDLSYVPGDICAIRESMSVPIYMLLTGRPPPSKSLASIGFVAWTRYKLNMSAASNLNHSTTAQAPQQQTPQPIAPRPCVILRETPINSPSGVVETRRVCLLATFHETQELHKLPGVLQHFCIPISPHRLAVPGITHTHTSPAWPKKDAWLLALPIETTAEIVGRWGVTADGSMNWGPFRLAADEFRGLLSSINNRSVSWSNLCLADVGLQRRSLMFYKAFCAEDNEKRKESLKNLKANKNRPSSTRTPGPSNDRPASVAGDVSSTQVSPPPALSQKSKGSFFDKLKKSDKQPAKCEPLTSAERANPVQRSYAQALTGIILAQTLPDEPAEKQTSPSIASGKSKSTAGSLRGLPLVRKLFNTSKSDIDEA